LAMRTTSKFNKIPGRRMAADQESRDLEGAELVDQGVQALLGGPPASADRFLEHGSSLLRAESESTTVQTDALKLLFGAGGIYAAFLYYGSLQEDVFSYIGSDGTKFTQAWFLQVLEALANVVIGYVGLRITGGTKQLPQKFFMISGASQVCSKAFTSLALANGLSFPVATLAKSGKMAPVMAGQLILGGAAYTVREYLQVVAIIGGTAILSLDKKKKGASESSTLGVFFILLSLVMDGVTGGVQKRLKANMKDVGVTPKAYDFMFYTNVYMAMVATAIALLGGEFASGLEYCAMNPKVLSLIIKFSLCSAIGQSFIFFTVAHFDPLVCSTVTTTRKIFSVLLSIFLKGHNLSFQGWAGVSCAVSGILSEVENKVREAHKRHYRNS